ncbi:MAG: hypothetical protein EPN97_06455 [Alphaproteobacteria bacterium]|nr:MAG: hypothetical protein EPN97_06455 [Alphaproteobacteria bacterium]
MRTQIIVFAVALVLMFVSFSIAVLPESWWFMGSLGLLAVLLGLQAIISGITGGGAGAGADEEGKFWLQRADSSTISIKDETCEGVMEAFLNFDWAAELENLKNLKKSQSVPPGLGLGSYGDEIFVHITMAKPDKVDILFVRRVKPGRKKDAFEEIYKEDFPVKKVDGVVRAYLDNDADKLVQMLG